MLQQTKTAMSIQRILTTIFAIISVKHKWQSDFLRELFDLIFSIQGRLTFENLSRYSDYAESTFRRNYKKFFDWLEFNWQLFLMSRTHLSSGAVIAAIDCSFIPKAGKTTYGVDRFFSSAAGRTKRGLEISLLCLIDTITTKAWSLHVRQTPGGLSTKQSDEDKATRIDHYMQQVKDVSPKLESIRYLVADGFYAKDKVFETMNELDKDLITKLRPDANLRYLYRGSRTGKRGRPPQYDGKVNWKDLDLRKWDYIGKDDKYDYLEIYTQVLNSPHFKRNFRIVMLVNTRTNKYILLACTDLQLDARTIVHYYQLRFKIEFLFRDAKQFCGLTHCQARSKEALHFHFNMSLAAVNLAQLKMELDLTTKSMNVFVRRAYNRRLIQWLFSQLSSEAEFDLNHHKVQQAIALGTLNYS